MLRRQLSQLGEVVARPSALGTLGTPASLPSWVVTILESMCVRSFAGGSAISSPSSLTSSSLVSSNMIKQRLALAAARVDQIGGVLVAEQVVADILHRLELARTGLGRREAARMVAVEAVEVGDVLEIADPLVDAEKVVAAQG